MKKFLTITGVLLCLLPLYALTDLGYYMQSARGHLLVMATARPIQELVADPQTASKTRQALTKVLEIRNFAVSDLHLPDNDSYRQYADIGQPYVLWNVVAAPEFSLEPKQWCFPVAGCVSYRGYFELAEAEAVGDRLTSEGMDVDVYGVKAYSTLNWFDDPVLNTFVEGSEASLAGLLFHELAHQVVYVAGDSPFNEAFAKTVEIEGVRRWYLKQASDEEWKQFHRHQQQVGAFHGFLKDSRDRLVELYRQPLAETEMRHVKQQLFSEIGARYRQLQDAGLFDNRFDLWMARGLNNARLAAVATYHDLRPGFQVLLEQCRQDLGCFYDEVGRLAKLDRSERLTRLTDLAQADPNPGQISLLQGSPAVTD